MSTSAVARLGLALAVSAAIFAGLPSAGSPLVVAGESLIAHAEVPTAPTAPWSKDDYDGKQFTTDQDDLTGLPVIHPVYLYAKDAPNRFDEFAAMFQAENRRASSALTRATGMGLRWDERLGADGTTRYHDITVLKSRKATFAQLSGNTQFKYVSNELAAAGLNLATKKYVVWLDAPSKVCGSSTMSASTTRAPSNPANGTSLSVLYRYYPMDTKNAAGQPTGGFCAPVLHELTHAFGAVLSVAPNSDGAHCKDDAQDYLCNFTTSPKPYDPNLPRQYDSGNNDYLDPVADLKDTTGGTLPWWTVNLNKFMCPRSAADPTRPDCDSANTRGY